MNFRRSIIILSFVIAASLAFPAEKNTQTEAEKPAFIRSSSPEAKPITRKDKTEEKQGRFETAHKFPPSLKFTLSELDDELDEKPRKGSKKVNKERLKRWAKPAEPPAPAPPGATRVSIQHLLEKYKEELKTSTTQKPTSTAKSSKRRGGSGRRTRRSAERLAATTSSPVLTTSRIAPKPVDEDVPLVAAGSEKQRSRIQVKKGPNGQEYEYEYVYYYYDDDEDSKDNKKANANAPTRNSIPRDEKPRSSNITPEVNEVVPPRTISRSRQLGEEAVDEERLPVATRFPPRNRNLDVTPQPEDNVSDESQKARGRTRANIRRPSLELVDSESFNTHQGTGSQTGASSGPTFPNELPQGPVRFLGATPNEFFDKPVDAIKLREPAAVSEVNDNDSRTTQDGSTDGTTAPPTTGMEKVALDLYAISQGTQKLFGESEGSTEEGKTGETDVTSSTDLSEAETTTTTTTTTSTTTTTTPKPTTTTTTTTTTEAPTKASRFGGRPRINLGSRKASTTTEAPTTEVSKPKKFGRPSFGGRGRPGKTTAAPVEEEVNKEESKSVSQSKPSTGRSRFGGSRTRARTTAAPSEPKEESSTQTPSSRPSLPRARPSFNGLRGRGRSTTAAPSSEEKEENNQSEDTSSSTQEVSSTTVRSRRVLPGNNANIKSLRPGPRINLAGSRRGTSTTTTTEAAVEEDNAAAEDNEAEAASETKEETSAAPVDNSPLGRLRSRSRVQVQQPKQKAAASAPVQVRRVNPLLGRRRPGQTTEAPASEAPQDVSSTEAEEVSEETQPASSSTTTTEEPRGLNKLLAGRRRLGARTPGTINSGTK